MKLAANGHKQRIQQHWKQLMLTAVCTDVYATDKRIRGSWEGRSEQTSSRYHADSLVYV
jgi:hypothetical protein